MIKTLQIENLLVSQDYQARRQTNPEVVRDYENCLKEGISLPPITVVDTGGELIVVDGFHRVFACKNQGRDRIQAEVGAGNHLYAVEQAIGANASHGLRRSAADKTRAVEMALNHPELAKESDRALATRCAVSHRFVSKIRASLGKERSNSKFARKTLPDRSKEVDTNPPQDVEFETYDPMQDALKELLEENEQLKTQIAIGFADGTELDKAMAESMIAELQLELKNAHIEIRALAASRDSYLRENNELKKQSLYYQRKIKRLNEQLDRQKPNDEAPLPFK
jgi:hypothetical protein